ncbi:MAG: hypothetical protein MUP98_19665 [Candidatus Aminicenantes bacterium]|nr:hypothetical protein [Candidatus Aminicenantes bacterium]
MRKIHLKSFMIVFSFFCLMESVMIGSQDISNLKGPYLGQDPPGKKSKVFAPGFVSTSENEFSITFSPNGKSCYFSRTGSNGQYSIFVSKETESGWTNPVEADFAGGTFSHEPYISIDGQTLFFGSMRPLPNGKTDYSIWTLKRKGQDWSDLQPLGFFAMYVTQTREGTLYFTSRGPGGACLAKSAYQNGQYLEPEILGEPFLSDYWDGHPCVAPDESWLIFDSENRPDAKECGLFISFRTENGEWTIPHHMIDKIPAGRFAMLSPDGKYLFYSTQGDIHWIDATIIEEIKQNILR